MLDVIEAVDGPIRLNVCLNPGKSCTRKPWCPAHPVWVRAQEAMLEVLATAWIRDLANGSDSIEASSTRRVGTIETIAASTVGQERCECMAQKGDD